MLLDANLRWWKVVNLGLLRFDICGLEKASICHFETPLPIALQQQKRDSAVLQLRKTRLWTHKMPRVDGRSKGGQPRE